MLPRPESEQNLKGELESIIQEFQNQAKLNEERVLESWHLVHAHIKSLASTRVSEAGETSEGLFIYTEVDQLLVELLPLFFRYWSQQKLLPEIAFQLLLNCIKLQNELLGLKESGLFNNQTLQTSERKLQNYRKELEKIKLQTDKEFLMQAMGMLYHKFDACESVLFSMKQELSSVDPALNPIHDRLLEIKLELESLLKRKSPHAFSLVEVQVLQEQVGEIDSARIDGKYITKDGAVVPGQAKVIDLLESCFEDIHELLASRDPLSTVNPLRAVYESLIKIKLELEQFMLYSKWTSKAEMLVPIQQKLGEIDNQRVDGRFMAPDGSIPEGQAVLHFLLHKCYRLIYKLQSSWEPVDQSLMPIYNQLLTLEKCLNQLRRWNVQLTDNELIPYQMKLTSIHSLQTGGKFYDDQGNIPEGQAILFDLLESCHDLVRGLQMKSSQ